MPNERPEFRPIEAAPGRPMWPFAVLGAVIAGLLIFIARRETGQPKQVALATVAPKIEAAPGMAETKIEPLVQQQPAAGAKESPNLIGTMGKLAMVARAELDRELGRTRSAQKQADAYRRQLGVLTKELTETRAQLAALQKSKAPPPPSDQEQILQMLAPVLRTSNDGHP